MNPQVFKAAAQVAGIGGIALVVFFYLNREVLRRRIFSSLTKQQSYRIIQLILVSCCVVSLSGIGAWVYISRQSPPIAPTIDTADNPSWSNLQEIEVETFDVPYPGLEKFWPTFQEDKWSGGVLGGKYYLTNSADAGGVQYFWEEMKVDASNLPLSADISFPDSKKVPTISVAGLLYRFDQDTKFYYAFCIDRDGRYTFYRRDANGLNPVSSGTVESMEGKADARLGIVGAGSDLHLYVNNKLVKVVHDEMLKRGLAGVVAAGLGTFGFDNFTVYKAAVKPPR